MAMVESGEIGQGETIVFWHTGGAPALFAYAEELMTRGMRKEIGTARRKSFGRRSRIYLRLHGDYRENSSSS